MAGGANATQEEHLTRDKILRLLSNEEVAGVSSPETENGLADGDEFIDLGKLEQGVQRAPAAKTSMGRVLTKNAVSEATWSKILLLLATSQPSPRQTH